MYFDVIYPSFWWVGRLRIATKSTGQICGSFLNQSYFIQKTIDQQDAASKRHHVTCAIYFVIASTSVRILSARSRRSHTSPFPSALPCSKPRTLPERFSLRGSTQSGAYIRGGRFSEAHLTHEPAHTAASRRPLCRCGRGCRTRGCNILCCREQ